MMSGVSGLTATSLLPLPFVAPEPADGPLDGDVEMDLDVAPQSSSSSSKASDIAKKVFMFPKSSIASERFLQRHIKSVFKGDALSFKLKFIDQTSGLAKAITFPAIAITNRYLNERSDLEPTYFDTQLEFANASERSNEKQATEKHSSAETSRGTKRTADVELQPPSKREKKDPDIQIPKDTTEPIEVSFENIDLGFPLSNKILGIWYAMRNGAEIREELTPQELCSVYRWCDFVRDKDLARKALAMLTTFPDLGQAITEYLYEQLITSDWQIDAIGENSVFWNFIFSTTPLIYGINIIHSYAKKGNPQAMFLLSCWHSRGTSIEDRRQAIEWVSKAAKAKNANAMNDLGERCALGRGGKKELDKAFEWYQPAAQKGHPLATYNLASCYYEGKGTEKDLEQAVIWFNKSAEAGNPAAMYSLGALSETGNGVDKDPQRAIYCYTQSALRGNAEAAKALVRLKLPIPTRVSSVSWHSTVPSSSSSAALSSASSSSSTPAVSSSSSTPVRA